jgi:uncharacterized protein YjbI with pentapeptide repeats
MNWTETRDRLIEINEEFGSLPEEWYWRTNLYGADLRGANLYGADLRGADLRGANLEGADLRGAYLRGANLEGADLEGANLRGANLRGANLRGANLRGANLYGADLRGADLRGAYLRGANLEGADLRGIIINWQSHQLLFEILSRAAGEDIEKNKVAGLIYAGQFKSWCWNWYVRNCSGDPLFGWAISELRKWVEEGDGAPEILK